MELLFSPSGRRLARIAYALMVLVIFVLAVGPTDDRLGTQSDKANHFIAFYVMALGAAILFPRARLSIIQAVLVAYGGMIELVQGLPFVGRDRELLDFMVDALAAAAALVPFALSGLRRVGPR